MYERLRYEARALGAGTFGLPLLVIVIFLGVSLLAAFDAGRSGDSATAHDYMAKGLLFLLEFGLPPLAGLVAANLVAGNPTLELHLSLRRSYVGVMLLRLALFTFWMALACIIAGILIEKTGYWIAPQPAPENFLIWAAPTCWCIGIGAVLTLLLRSSITSSALLGMLWLAELLFHALLLQNAALQKVYLFLTIETLKSGSVPNASYWLANRLTLVVMAVLFLGGIVWSLQRNEYLLGHEV